MDIEINKLEDQYQRLYNFNQRILDNVPVSIMVINDDGKIVSVNRHFENFTGSNNTVGRLIYDIDFYKRENLIDSYRELFQTGKAFTKNNCRTVNKKGEIKFLNITVVPVKDPEGKKVGALSMAVDNTENHLYQERLKELNTELEKEVKERALAEEQVKKLSEVNQKILDNAPFSILMMDKEGNITGANRMALDMMDSEGASIFGKNLLDTIEIKENDDLTGKFGLLLKKGKMFYHDNLSYVRRVSGEQRHLNIIAVPLIDRKGGIEGAISIATDNTEALEAKNKLTMAKEDLELKVLERTRDLDKINKRLSDVLDMKSKYVADASHELRTPLTVIRGNIDLAIIRLKKENREVPEIYEVILNEVENMRSVLTDLSILSDADMDDELAKCEIVDIGKILSSVARSLKILAEQKDIKLIYADDPAGIHAAGDAIKLEKLFSNIVRNAIKYTDRGGYVKITSGESKDGIVVTVEDNGIGIPENDLPHIFDRFYRVDKERIRDEGGSGLGLSIAKLIVDAHQGSISVESEVGKGSIFTVWLPLDCRKIIDKKLGL